MAFVKDPNRKVNANENVKAIIGDENAVKMGHFSESTGGGTPLEKGEKLKDHPEAKRVQQPRDEEGKFTYNSVNGLELKYGPSRGITIPPILSGVEFTFYQKGTKLKLDTEDGKTKIKMMTFNATKEEMIDMFKYYFQHADKESDKYKNDESHKEFHDKYDDKYEEGFVELDSKAGAFVDKKGRPSKDEKEAKPGFAGYKDPKTLSENSQKEMEDVFQEYMGSPYYNWIFNSGSKINPVPKENPSPNNINTDDPNKTGTGTGEPNDKPNDKPKNKPNNSSDILKQMGLDDDDKEFDKKAASDDPKAFANTPLFKSIWKTVPKSVKDSGKLKAGTLIHAIAMGKFKNPAHVKQWIKHHYGE